MYKQVILMRMDLKLPKGKMAAQAAHAAVEAVSRADREIISRWRREGQGKIILKVDSKEDLHKFNQAAKDAGIATALITDAGKTVIAPGTETCVAIGPDDEDKIDLITGNLKLV